MSYILSDKKASGCVFCAKAATPADDRANHVVARTERAMLLLNIYPYSNGHLMALPYAHVGSLTELDDDQLAELMRLTRLAEQALRDALSPQGFNVGINIGKASGAGLEEHLHIHIVPRWAGDTNFMTVVAQTRTIPELLDDTRERVAQALADLGYPRDADTGTVYVPTKE
jgi:ATP adenylyltransferase